jgi:hypothetical protein
VSEEPAQGGEKTKIKIRVEKEAPGLREERNV